MYCTFNCIYESICLLGNGCETKRYRTSKESNRKDVMPNVIILERNIRLCPYWPLGTFSFYSLYQNIRQSYQEHNNTHNSINYYSIRPIYWKVGCKFVQNYYTIEVGKELHNIWPNNVKCITFDTSTTKLKTYFSKLIV